MHISAIFWPMWDEIKYRRIHCGHHASNNKKLCYCRETKRRTMLVSIFVAMFHKIWLSERFQTAKLTYQVIQAH